MSRPYRAEIHFTFLAENQEEACDKFTEAAEAMETAWVMFEGGFVEAMEADDVIQGSPLYEALKA